MRTQERARYSAHRNTGCQDRTEATERPRLAGFVMRGTSRQGAKSAKSAKPRQGIFCWGMQRPFPTSRVGTGGSAQRNSLGGFGGSRLDRLAQCNVPVTIVTACGQPHLAEWFRLVTKCCVPVRIVTGAMASKGHRGGAEPRHGAAFSGAPAEARRRGAAAEERATSRAPTAALRSRRARSRERKQPPLVSSIRMAPSGDR